MALIVYDVMKVTYNSKPIQFNGASYVNAHASFSTTDKSNPLAYTVTYFNDGYNNFADAFVSAVSGDDVTVKYGTNGYRSIQFKGVDFDSDTDTYATNITAKFQINSSGVVSITQFKDNSIDVSPTSRYGAPTATKTTSKTWANGQWNYYYTVTVLYDGVLYTFNNVLFINAGGTSDVKTASRIVTTYSVSNEGQHYYYAHANLTEKINIENVNYRFVYTASPVALTVQKKSGVNWVNDGVFTQSATTTIEPNAQGGYTVTEITAGDTV